MGHVIAWVLGYVVMRLGLIFLGAVLITLNVNQMIGFGELNVWSVIWTALGIVLIGFNPRAVVKKED